MVSPGPFLISLFKKIFMVAHSLSVILGGFALSQGRIGREKERTTKKSPSYPIKRYFFGLMDSIQNVFYFNLKMKLNFFSEVSAPFGMSLQSGIAFSLQSLDFEENQADQLYLLANLACPGKHLISGVRLNSINKKSLTSFEQDIVMSQWWLSCSEAREVACASVQNYRNRQFTNKDAKIAF